MERKVGGSTKSSHIEGSMQGLNGDGKSTNPTVICAKKVVGQSTGCEHFVVRSAF